MDDLEKGVESALNEFTAPDFQVDSYAQKLLSSATTVNEHLLQLNSTTAALDKQLKKQISSHHEKLLTQATSIESLEDILDSLNQHISTLQSGVDRAVGRASDLYKKTELRTRQLTRLHETCNLLRAMMRVMALTGKLQHMAAGGSAAGRDMVKASLMLQELTEIIEDTDLKGIEAVERDLVLVPKFSKEMRSKAQEALRQGLRSQNHSLVGNALQAFSNMHCLKQQLQLLLKDMTEEITHSLEDLGKCGLKLTAQKVGDSAQPGRVNLGPQAPSSAAIRANLWEKVQNMSDCILSCQAQLNVLQAVTERKKDSVSRKAMSEEMEVGRLIHQFWTQVGSVLKEGLTGTKCTTVVKQTLESEYPKLLRQMMTVFVQADRQNIHDKNFADLPRSDEKPEDQKIGSLRSCMTPLETAYLSKSLSRLFDSVNMGFSSDRPPSSAEIESMGQVVASEMQVAAFDTYLFQQVCKNVTKTVQLFAVKCEGLLITDGEASQVIGNPSPGQKRNVGVVNAIQGLRTVVINQLGQATDVCDVRDREGHTEALQSLVDACDQLLNLIRLAVEPLLASVQDAVSAILDTMHNEQFDFELPNDPNAPAEHQCSLYMRELQTFVSRVWQDHLAPLVCRDFVHELGAEVARKAVQLFLIHASLVRPIGEGGKLRLAADFAQMELAISPLCRRLSTDVGMEYLALRATRPLLFMTPEQIATDECVGKEVPYWLVVQLLICMSPAELMSPHITADWSIARYSSWMVEHNSDRERLQFLKGTLEAYARSVSAQGKTEYVATYPVILDLLKKATEELRN